MHVERKIIHRFTGMMILYLVFIVSYRYLYIEPSICNKLDALHRFESMFPIEVVEETPRYSRTEYPGGGRVSDRRFDNCSEFLNFVSKYEIIKVARLSSLRMTRVEYAVTVLKYDYPGSTSTYIVEYSYRVSLEKQNDGFFKVQEYRIT